MGLCVWRSCFIHDQEICQESRLQSQVIAQEDGISLEGFDWWKA
jgi:hypothetical protein